MSKSKLWEWLLLACAVAYLSAWLVRPDWYAAVVAAKEMLEGKP